jgi:hypothetical protein
MQKPNRAQPQKNASVRPPLATNKNQNNKNVSMPKNMKK